MKRTLLAAAAVLLVATTAQAVTLSRSGSWKNFYVIGENNTPICGMQVDGNGTSLMVKYMTGKELLVQIFKQGWRIPKGTDIPGYIAFDKSPHFPFAGNGYMSANTNAGVIEFRIVAGTEADFLHEFGEADHFIIGFDQGTQPPMVADMTGSRQAAAVFARCSAVMDARANDTPQPFASQPAPQPFGKQLQPATQTKKKDDGSI